MYPIIDSEKIFSVLVENHLVETTMQLGIFNKLVSVQMIVTLGGDAKPLALSPTHLHTKKLMGGFLTLINY